jgi:flagellar biogenesis protein FliO
MIASPIDPPPPPPPDLGIGAGPILQAVLALLLTCALAIFVLQLLKKGRLPGWLRGRDPRAGPGRDALQVLARLQLSDGQEVFLLQAAGRCLLIGAGPAGPRLLTELPRDEVARALGGPVTDQDKDREAGP